MFSDPKAKKEAIPYVKALTDFFYCSFNYFVFTSLRIARSYWQISRKDRRHCQSIKKITIVKETDIQMWENVETIFHAIYL